MATNKKNLGQGLLRAYLEGHHKSQEAFGDTVGITRKTVNRFLSGVRTPNLETAFQIQKATQGMVPAASWIEKMSSKRRD